MHVEFLHSMNMSLGLFSKEMYWCAAFQYAICCSLSFCVLNITYLALFLEGKFWKVLKCDLQTGQPLSEALSAGERKRLPSFMRRVWKQEEKWPIRGQEEPVPEQVSPVWGSLKLLCVCLCAVSRTYLSRKTLLILKKNRIKHRLWRLEVFWFCVSPASACLPARVPIKRTFTRELWIWCLQVKSSSQKMRLSRCLNGWRTVCSAPVCRVER